MKLPTAIGLVLLAAACRLEKSASGRPPGPPTPADSLARVERDSASRAAVLAALRVYYARFSDRDWSAFRRSFWPAATITTRFRPPGEPRERVVVTTIDEFIRQAPRGPGRMAVFSERMLESRVTVYGDLAGAWATYEARWGQTQDSVRVIRGVDAFSLYRDGGEWRIVSLVFTAEQPGVPLEPASPHLPGDLRTDRVPRGAR